MLIAQNFFILIVTTFYRLFPMNRAPPWSIHVGHPHFSSRLVQALLGKYIYWLKDDDTPRTLANFHREVGLLLLFTFY